MPNKVSITMKCRFCNKYPTIKNSHVVPRYIVKYVKKNSPFGFLYNSWSQKEQWDGYKGPYLCQKCDNELFSSWEVFFKHNVLELISSSCAKWQNEKSIKFLLSLVYRYAIHFQETSLTKNNKAYHQCVEKVTKDALLDISKVGSTVYIYPYVYTPILNGCDFMPGINHLLNLAFHGEILPNENENEGDLPNGFLILLPKLLVLFTDCDISKSKDSNLENVNDLRTHGQYDSLNSNTNMPIFLMSILNRKINEGQSNQKQIGKWKKLAYGADKLLNPKKVCYEMQEKDSELQLWQRNNKCANKVN